MLRRRSSSTILLTVLLVVLFFGKLPHVNSDAPTVGPQNVIILLVEFPDVKHRVFGDHIERLGKALSEYYVEQSYGQLLLKVDINQHWHTASQPFSYYDLSPGTPSKTRLELIKEAMTMADTEVDFSKYPFVIVLHAGSGQTSWEFVPELGWGSGVCFARLHGSCQDRVALDNEDDWGTTFHEFGHLLGLPDLYDLTLLFQGVADYRIYVGLWDLMSGFLGQQTPNGLSAWSRSKLGWISGDRIASLSKPNGQNFSITLAPLETGNEILSIIIPVNSTRYYVIENRQAIGYDSNLPGTGVLVYMAYEDIYNDGQRGTYRGPVRIVNRDLKALDAPTMGFFDDKNDIAIVLSKKTSLSYQVEVTNASVGRRIVLDIQQHLRYISLQAMAATDSIAQASAAIELALSENRTDGLTEARQFWQRAKTAFSVGNYALAKALAQLAQRTALNAKNPAPSTRSTTVSTGESRESISSIGFIDSEVVFAAVGLTVASIIAFSIMRLRRNKHYPKQ